MNDLPVDLEGAARWWDPHAELWEPMDAGHCGAIGAEPAEYERRVVGWFESNNAPPDPEEVVHRRI